MTFWFIFCDVPF